MANRAYYCLIITLLFIPLMLRAQSDTVACESPVEASNSDSLAATFQTTHFPVSSDYYYSYCEVLMDSSEMAALVGYDIEYFAFLPTTLNDGCQYNDGCKIYMANTHHTLNNGLLQNNDNNFQLVYTGTLNFTEAGAWRVVRLDSTFRWDGHSHVVIAISRSHALDNHQHPNACQFAAWHFTGDYVKARYVARDDEAYNMNNTIGFSYTTPYLPYYKLLTCSEYDPHSGEVEVCDTVVSLRVSDITAEQAVVTWSGEGASYDLRYRHVGQDAAPEHYVFGLTEQHYTISDYLQAGQEHYVQVRQTCSNEITSSWSTAYFMVPEKEGIAETETTSTMLYPNPAHNVLSVSTLETTTLQIVDMQGRTMLLMTLAAGEHSIDVSTLAKGSYLTLLSGTEGRTVRRLIIR